jgi:hypothetical protein
MATTRRLLEQVPGHLAHLIAWMPGWIANTLRELSLDVAKAPKYSFEKTDALLKEFHTNVRAAHDALPVLV